MPILLAALLALAESLALLVFAVVLLVDDAAEALAWGTAALLLAYAAGQGVAAVQLVRLRLGARGPLVVTQLIQVGLAWQLRSSDRPWLAWVLGAVALVVLGCLLAPSTTRRLEAAEPVPE